MRYKIRYHSTSQLHVNAKRNLLARQEAVDFLKEHSDFRAGGVPTIGDTENDQRYLRSKGLVKTYLHGDNAVVAKDPKGNVLGVGRFYLGHVFHKLVTDGYLVAAQDQISRANLAQLFVLPSARSQGIGTKIVETVLDMAKEQGFKQVFGYADGNVAALETFYRKLGFEVETGPRPASVFGHVPNEIIILGSRSDGFYFQKAFR